MADCNKCASSTFCERVWKGMNNPMCVGFKPKKTNADDIRTMNDLELAKWLQERGCEYCCARNACIKNPLGNCLSTILDWLQQEAENDGTGT